MAKLIIIDENGLKWEREVPDDKIRNVAVYGEKLGVEVKGYEKIIKCDYVKWEHK